MKGQGNLGETLDRLLGPAGSEEVGLHLAGCSACREKHGSLGELAREAAS